jgi:penicillin amidase
MTTKTVTHAASPILPATGGEPETRVVEQEVALIEQDGAQMSVVSWNPEENVAFCQRRSTYLEELGGAFQWAELGRADDIDDFEDKLSEFPFTFNFHVIDDQGNLGFVHTGKVPDRDPAVDTRFPQPSDLHNWSRIRTGLGLGTHDRNPSTGYYTNWNNGPAARWRAGDGEQNWGSHHRVEVLDHFVRERLAETNDNLTLGDVRDIIELAAKHDSNANESAALLADIARRGPPDEQVDAMAAELEAWADDYCAWDDGGGTLGDEGFDGDAAADARDTYVHAGFAIWEEVRIELQELIFGDELGPRNYEPDWAPDASRHAGEHGNATTEVTFVDVLHGRTDSDHDWFTDLDTGEERSRREVVREAFENAADTLTERFGSSDPSTWLREEHKSVFRVLGAVQGEAIDMVNRSTYQHAVEMGAGLEGSMDALPPSNSGHVTAPELLQFLAGTSDEPARVDDQLELYANFDYKPHPVTREQVESVAVTSETLRATNERPDLPAEFSRTTANVLVQQLLTASEQGRDLVGGGVSTD